MLEKLKKLEKYFNNVGETFRKKKTLKTYIDNLCDYLNIPRIKILVYKHKKYDVENDIHVFAYFSITSKGKPYIVFYRHGMARRAARHEIVHYLQYIQDGADRFLNPDYDEEYEIEAQILEECNESELKLRLVLREFVKSITGKK